MCNVRSIVYKAEISQQQTPSAAIRSTANSTASHPNASIVQPVNSPNIDVSSSSSTSNRLIPLSNQLQRSHSSASNTKIYYGSCEPEFKSRFNNHTHTFRHPNKANATKLSKFYWSSINNNGNPIVKWSIKKISTPHKCGMRRCNLCLDEKFIILTAGKDNNVLNKRSEIMAKCGHKNKFKLKNVKSDLFV